MSRAIAATLALVIGLGVGWLASQLRSSAPSQGKVTVITLIDAPEAGRCIARTADPSVKLKRDYFMLWRIEDKCQFRQPGSRVELRFSPPGPFNSPNIVGDTTIFEFVRQDPPPDYGHYPYKVWMLPQDGDPYEMEDPEVEIVWIM